MLLILVAIVSLLPSLLVFFWMRNKSNLEARDKGVCDKAFRYGLFCVVPIFFLSGVTFLLLAFTGLKQTNPLLYQAIYKFIVLALAEEIAKFFMFKYLLKKENYTCNWLMAVILMTAVSIGFSTIESVTFSIGASIPVMIARAISFPHVGYGFLVGYYYGKGIEEGKPSLWWVGFLLAWFIHGLYDFSLSDEILALNDSLVFLPFLLIAVDIILVVVLVRFILKKRNKQSGATTLPNNS